MYYDDDRRRKRKTETNKMRDGNETSFATLLRGDLSIITRQLKETEKKRERENRKFRVVSINFLQVG
jgi:hypothetical protein